MCRALVFSPTCSLMRTHTYLTKALFFAHTHTFSSFNTCVRACAHREDDVIWEIPLLHSNLQLILLLFNQINFKKLLAMSNIFMIQSADVLFLLSFCTYSRITYPFFVISLRISRNSLPEAIFSGFRHRLLNLFYEKFYV